jgi:hypothetical protein
LPGTAHVLGDRDAAVTSASMARIEVALIASIGDRMRLAVAG